MPTATTFDTGGPEDPILDLRLRAIRRSLWTIVVFYGGLAVWPWIGTPLPQRPVYWLFVAGAGATSLGAFAVPWDRVLRHRHGYHALVVFFSVTSTTAGALVLLSSGVAPESFLAFFVPVALFSAVVFTPAHQVLISTVGAAAWLAARVMVEPTPSVGGLALVVLLIAAGVTSTSLLGRLVVQVIAEAARSEAGARRRSNLLGAMRPMRSLDADEVLQTVADAVVSIDFDRAGVFGLAEGRVDIRGQANLPELGDLPPDGGFPLVGHAGGPKVINDYRCYPSAMAPLLRAGVRCCVVAPVAVHGDVVGLVVAMCSSPREPDPDAVFAVGVLADEAGRALEAVAAFDEEHEQSRRLAELDAMKTDFVSTVSHELRTPITVVRGVATTLRELGPKLGTESVDLLLDRLVANANRLNATVDELLDFSRFRGAPPDVHLRPTSLWSLTAKVADGLRGRATEHPLVVDLPRGLMVQADPDVLGQAMDALLHNAFLHTPPGTEVRVAAEVVGPGRVRVTIADDGPGIPQDVLVRAEEGFARGGGHLTRTSGGLGLGLAIAYRCIGAHASHLELARRPRGGTVARFDLALVNARNRGRGHADGVTSDPSAGRPHERQPATESAGGRS